MSVPPDSLTDRHEVHTLESSASDPSTVEVTTQIKLFPWCLLVDALTKTVGVMTIISNFTSQKLNNLDKKLNEMKVDEIKQKVEELTKGQDHLNDKYQAHELVFRERLRQ